MAIDRDAVFCWAFRRRVGGIGMSVFMAMLLGLLQGATILLPISYSGHQAIFQNLFKLDYAKYDNGLFSLLMSLSTLISIYLVYRNELGQMRQEGSDFLRDRDYEDSISEGRFSPTIRMIYFIIVGTLPLLLSIPINQRIDILLSNTVFIGFAMLVMGALLFVTDKYIKDGKKNEKTMTTKDALQIGVAQAFAAIPGLSRIGTTAAVSLSCGLNKDFAIRFSVFLSLPTVLISVLASFFTMFRTGIDWSSFFSYLIGFIVSVFIGYLSIQTLRILTAKRKLRNFSYYLWGAGLITIILSLIL